MVEGAAAVEARSPDPGRAGDLRVGKLLKESIFTLRYILERENVSRGSSMAWRLSPG